MNTLNARRTVIPKVTLSPESGGITNTSSVKALNIMHGIITFIMKNSTRRRIFKINVTSGNGSGLTMKKKFNFQNLYHFQISRKCCTSMDNKRRYEPESSWWVPIHHSAHNLTNQYFPFDLSRLLEIRRMSNFLF